MPKKGQKIRNVTNRERSLIIRLHNEGQGISDIMQDPGVHTSQATVNRCIKAYRDGLINEQGEKIGKAIHTDIIKPVTVEEVPAKDTKDILETLTLEAMEASDTAAGIARELEKMAEYAGVIQRYEDLKDAQVALKDENARLQSELAYYKRLEEEKLREDEAERKKRAHKQLAVYGE